MNNTNKEARRHFEITIPGKVEDIVGYICNDKKTNPLQALRLFYNSETYRKLEIESTKYWHWGSVSLYQEYLQEMSGKNYRQPGQNFHDAPVETKDQKLA